jgi:deoxycytidine triphosphate deaminase
MADVHPWKYLDPEHDNPSRKGMLLSNEIAKFQQHDLLIAEDFEVNNLRPAAYTLRVGSKYVDSKGRIGRLDKIKKPYFCMEPNSIVYVSALEKLDLPHYIAARFNLRVKWVYKGILLGTGPQVEPGYRGYLSCPLYNLTDRPIKITYGEDFATIDFERTTDFCPNANVDDIRSATKPEDQLDRIEWNKETFLVFKDKEYQALKLLPDHDVISSLFQLSHEVTTWRHIGIGFAVSFFALTLTLLGFGSNVYRQVTDLANQLSATRSELKDAQQAAQASADAIANLKERTATLENQAEAIQRANAPRH